MMPGERMAGFESVPWMGIATGLGIALLWFHGIGFLIKLALFLLLASVVYRWWNRTAAYSAPEGAWQGGRGVGRWRNCGVGTMFQNAGDWNGARRAGPSGNSAFEEYRQATLRRLEEDQREFQEFLQRLRQAKDKAEFDEFMASRGRRPETPPQPETL